MQKSIAQELLELLFNNGELRPEATVLIPTDVEADEKKSYLLNTLAPLALPIEFVAENAKDMDKRLIVLEGHYDDMVIVQDYAGFADMIINIFLDGNESELDQYIIATIFEDNAVSEFVKINLAAEMLTRTYKKIGLVGSGKIDVGEQQEDYLHALLNTYEVLFERFGGLLIKGYEEEMLEIDNLEGALMDWSWLLVSTLASHITVPLQVASRLNESILGFAIGKLDDTQMIRNMIKLYDDAVVNVTLTGGYTGNTVRAMAAPLPHSNVLEDEQTAPKEFIDESYDMGPGESNETYKTPDALIVLASEEVTSVTVLIIDNPKGAESMFRDKMPSIFPNHQSFRTLMVSKFDLEEFENNIKENTLHLVIFNCELTPEITKALSDTAKLNNAAIVISASNIGVDSFHVTSSLSVVYKDDVLTKCRLDKSKYPFPTTLDGFSCNYDAELALKQLTSTGVKVSHGYLYKVHEVAESLATVLRRDYSTVLDREVIFQLTVDSDENVFYINDNQVVIVLHIDEINESLYDLDVEIVRNNILDSFDLTVLKSLGCAESPRAGHARKIAPTFSNTPQNEDVKEEIFRLFNGAISFSEMRDMTTEELVTMRDKRVADMKADIKQPTKPIRE